MKNLTKRNFNEGEKALLGKYIYALRDPRDSKVFYIGQGTGDRLFAHFDEAEKYLNGSNKALASKILRIVDIWSNNEDVEWFIISHQVNEDINPVDAIESALIDLLSISQNGQALNQIKGIHSKFLDPTMLSNRSANYVNPDNQYKSVFLFPIQNQIANGLSPYDATRCCWYVTQANRNLQNTIAIGISNFISLGVFKIGQWIQQNDLFKFNGKIYEEHELLNKNFRNVISKSLGYWQRGNYLIVDFDGNGKFQFVRGNPNTNDWYSL